MNKKKLFSYLFLKKISIKKESKFFFILVLLGLFSAYSQVVTIDDSLTPEELLTTTLFSNISGNCRVSQNENFNNSGSAFGTNSLGSFTASGNDLFDLDKGIVLSTGKAINAGDNNTVNNEGNTSWTGNSLYENILGLPANSTTNATDIEFDIFATQNNISFEYVFASDEYRESSTKICNSNEGFLFLIKEKGAPDSDFRNIALLNSGDPVLVKNLKQNQNTFCAESNQNQIARGKGADSSINFAQYSRTLTANTASVKDTEYTIRLIIADEGDTNNDSAIFIQAPIFTGVELTLMGNAGETDKISVCGTSAVINSLLNVTPSSLTLEWFNETKADNIVLGTDPTLMAIESGVYRLRLSFPWLDNLDICVLEKTIEVDLDPIKVGSPIADLLSECTIASATTGTFNLSSKNGEALIGRASSLVEYFNTRAEAENEFSTPISNITSYNGINNEEIFVRVIEGDCRYISSFRLLIQSGDSVPIVTPAREFLVCDNPNIVSGSIIPADGFYTLFGPDITTRVFSGDALIPAGTFEYFEDNLFITPLNPSKVFNTSMTIYARFISDNGCVSSIPIPISIILELEPEAPTLEDLIVCNVNKSDPAIFNINEQTPIITAAITSGPVSITYHGSEAEAIDNVNPILPLGAEEFIISDPNLNPRQILAARIVRSAGSQCPVIRTFQVDARHLLDPEVTRMPTLNACDDDGDDKAIFELSGLKAAITTEFTVELYANEADFTAGVQITDTELAGYEVEKGVNEVIIVRLLDTDLTPVCEDRFNLTLNILPQVVLDGPIGTFELCENDARGMNSYFIDEIEPLITPRNGETISLAYFDNDPRLTSPVATLIDDNYDRSSNIGTQTFWARATSSNACIAVTSFDVEILDAPTVTTNIAPEITICLAPSASLLYSVNSNEASIIPSGQTNIEILYSKSLDLINRKLAGDVITGDPDIIVDPSNFTERTTAIYILVQNTITACFEIIEQPILINDQPVVLTTPPTVLVCFNTLQLQADYDLLNEIDNNNNLRNGQTNTSVRFFEIRNDLTSEITVNPYTSGNKTIFYRIETNTDSNCFSDFGELKLEIGENADLSIDPRLKDCDNDDDKLGQRPFNLQEYIDRVEAKNLGKIKEITFFENADLTNPITNLIYENTQPFGQDITALVETTNNCKVTQQVQLQVDIEPIAKNIKDLLFCDLLPFGNEIVDIRQEPFDFDLPGGRLPVLTSVTYFDSKGDEIADPANYELKQVNQTNANGEQFTVVLETSTCDFSTPFSVRFKPLPVIVSDTIEVCEDAFNSNEFNTPNLSNFDNLFYKGTDANVEVLYFEDADGLVEIDKTLPFTKTNLINEIYVNAIDNEVSSRCLSNEKPLRVPLIASSLPIANSPNPRILSICDEDLNLIDGIADFDFAMKLDSEILGTQNTANFTITYHSTRPITFDEVGLTNTTRASNGTIYYARIVNNRTNCFNTIDFTITVNPIPQIEDITNEVLELCDLGNDNTESFDLTEIENSPIFTTVTGAETSYTVSYFSNLERTMPIVTPSNYSITNFGEQTIYISLISTINTRCVFNTSFKINLKQLPQINTLSNPFLFCEDDLFGKRRSELTTRLFRDTSNLDISYYTDSSASIEFLDDTPIPKTSSPFSIFVIAQNTLTRCENTATVILQQLDLPIFNTPTTTFICDEDDINDGIFAVDFNTLTTEILGAQNPANFTVTYHRTSNDADNSIRIASDELIGSGTYFAKIDRREIEMCSVIGSFTLTINKLPEVILSNDVTFCINDPLREINPDPENELASTVIYQWEFRDNTGSIVKTENTKLITLSPSDIGNTITLTATDTATNCSDNAEFSVIQSQSPEIIIDDIIKGFDVNQITVQLATTGDYTYGYNDPNEANSQESNVFENVLPGRHTIWVFDKNGCEPASKEFDFIDYFPYFSPNGSGPSETETWHIRSIDQIPETLVYIYNRYGKLLKTLTSKTEGWDGTYNGIPLPSDDYWILIELPDGEQIKDHITLKR